jgi:glutamate synthase (NADPH/NADH) large chain
MTGGRVVVLGPTGRNFAAGMSGGTAFVLDRAGDFETRCNPGMVDLDPLDLDDLELVRRLVETHATLTGSAYAETLLRDWATTVLRFVKVMPRDYKRVLRAQAKARAEARVPAFEELLDVAYG